MACCNNNACAACNPGKYDEINAYQKEMGDLCKQSNARLASKLLKSKNKIEKEKLEDALRRKYNDKIYDAMDELYEKIEVLRGKLKF
jgi:hypothetical protein